MPDNFIQQPENTQNYNRYAYVLNNPLMYTDPSGEEFISLGIAVLIGAVVSAATYTLTALLADVPFSVGGLVKATFIGAASAAVTFGIGSAATNMFVNFYSQAAFQAVAHGTFQGTMTAISGGKFWSGFAAGALSSIASSAWGGGTTKTEGFSAENNWAYGVKTIHHAGLGAGTGTAGMIAFGTIVGGGSAMLTGGNFWQGAATGLVVSGLNHAAHKMGDDWDIDPPAKKSFAKRAQDAFNNHTTAAGNTLTIGGGYATALEDFSHVNAGKVYKYGTKSASALQLTRANKIFQLRIAKFASVGGKLLGVAGGGVSLYQYSQNQISGHELTWDLIMTGVGVFGGPAGAGASLIYFGGKAIYNYYNPNNPMFAVPKN